MKTVKKHINFWPSYFERKIFYEKYNELWGKINTGVEVEIEDGVFEEIKQYVELVSEKASPKPKIIKPKMNIAQSEEINIKDN